MDKKIQTKIKSVTVEINGQEITMPVETARELFKELQELFEKSAAPFKWPEIFPHSPPNMPWAPPAINPFPIPGPIWTGPHINPTCNDVNYHY